MNGHTILIVDDERYVVKTLQRTLAEEDYNVLIATSGSDALKIMEKEEEEVSLVISDYRMPLMDGIELLEKVRDRWHDTVRILLTAYGDSQIIEEAVNNVGVYQVIPKPWKSEELKAIVKEALSTRSHATVIKSSQGNPNNENSD